MTDPHPTIHGYCPACRGESLFLGSGGYVTCRRLDCPDPEAATRALETHPDAHVYLSTGCLHGQHDYCAAMTGMQGAKRPAACKFCGAACQCPCGHKGADSDA